MRTRFVTLALAVVLIHLAVNRAHGWAHLTKPVPNTPAQNAFIIPVIGIAPLVAAWLVLTGRITAGAWLLALSMLGAFLFGVAYHYVIQSPDHVSHVPGGTAGSVFRASALGLAVVELAGFVVGAFGVGRAQPADRARTAELTPRVPRP